MCSLMATFLRQPNQVDRRLGRITQSSSNMISPHYWTLLVSLSTCCSCHVSPATSPPSLRVFCLQLRQAPAITHFTRPPKLHPRTIITNFFTCSSPQTTCEGFTRTRLRPWGARNSSSEVFRSMPVLPLGPPRGATGFYQFPVRPRQVPGTQHLCKRAAVPYRSAE